ncbi:MAG: dehydrogenase [Prevotella sp.]|nr:dehydrogenase [Prevotella sp.]
MADGYLEKHQQDYEARKADYLRRKRHLPPTTKPRLQRPEDEAL